MRGLLGLGVRLCLVMIFGVAVRPAAAQDCVPASGTAADETFECAGGNGVDVGTGDDVVNITGEVAVVSVGTR